MKIRWKLTEFDGLEINDIDDEKYSFIKYNECLYVEGNIHESSGLKYLKIKERMKITFWI